MTYLQSYQIAIYKDGDLVDDWSTIASPPVITRNEHGDESATLDVEFSPVEATFAFDRARTSDEFIITTGYRPVFEGRIEDVAITPNGLSVTAFGNWRRLTDVTFTSLFSTTSVAGFKSVRSSDSSVWTAEQYEVDNNNRVFIAPRGGETISDRGGMYYQKPIGVSGESEDIVRVFADWETWSSGSGGWAARIDSATTGWSVTTQYTDAISGSQSGSLDVTLSSPAPIVIFGMGRLSGSASVTDTGDVFVRFTNIRIVTIDDTSITPEDIIPVILAKSDTHNPGAISQSTDGVEAHDQDVEDFLLEDVQLADALVNLATRPGKGDTPFVAGVGRDRVLYFRDRAVKRRSWSIDLNDEVVALSHSLAAVFNAAYSLYKDADGRPRRTSPDGTDQDSIDFFGVERRTFVAVNTTSATRADLDRDAFLEASADPEARSVFATRELFVKKPGSSPASVLELQPGDDVHMKNISPALYRQATPEIEVVVSRLTVDFATGIAVIEPGAPLPDSSSLMSITPADEYSINEVGPSPIGFEGGSKPIKPTVTKRMKVA